MTHVQVEIIAVFKTLQVKFIDHCTFKFLIIISVFEFTSTLISQFSNKTSCTS